MPKPAFEARIESLGPEGLRACLERTGKPLSWAEALEAWRSRDAFRQAFLRVLTDAPWPAYRWETPAVTAASVARPFEFVLLAAPWLEVPADPSAFREHLAAVGRGPDIATFPNLGGDAVLIAPAERGPRAAYGHLAAFVRGAPPRQVHALWRAVGCTMMERLSDRPVWLSTAGGGVPWLHVRLDDRPKYYGHRPYTAELS